MFAPRTRDYIYLIFLLIHIPATLLVDLQALFFAKDLVPTALRKICEFWTRGAITEAFADPFSRLAVEFA